MSKHKCMGALSARVKRRPRARGTEQGGVGRGQQRRQGRHLSPGVGAQCCAPQLGGEGLGRWSLGRQGRASGLKAGGVDKAKEGPS